MNLKAPEDNLKMAGDPACQPRFGFLAPPQKKDGKDVYVVSEVVPGSPAKSAGMRIGDVLLAVDSEEYSDTSIPDSLSSARESQFSS